MEYPYNYIIALAFFLFPFAVFISAYKMFKFLSNKNQKTLLKK